MNQTTTTHSADCAILYVDDEEMALKYFQRALADEFQIYTATDAEAGLEILAAHGDAIGILVSDQRMPGLSGVELLKQVRRRWPHILRILTTAYADLDDAIEAVNRGEIFRYITKPWDTRALRAETRQARDLFRLQRERTELVREKMSVWQRMVTLGRFRDLMVLGRSIESIRHGENAMARYLIDHVTSAPHSDLASSRHLDLWQLTESEIDNTLAFVSTVLSHVAKIGDPRNIFDSTLDEARLLELLRSTFGSVTACTEIPTIRVDEPSVTQLFDNLAAAIGHPAGPVTIEAVPDGSAVTIAIPCNELARKSDLTSPDAATTLSAYLFAFHHGGHLQLKSPDGACRYVATLPVDPAGTRLAPPGTQWLQATLARLEPWD